MGGGNVDAHVNGVDDRAALTLALRRDRTWVDRCDALPLENGFHERSSTSQGSGSRWKSTDKTYFTRTEDSDRLTFSGENRNRKGSEDVHRRRQQDATETVAGGGNGQTR